jgi:uncharacterized protein YqjF (DUF2071 family)
MRAPVAPPVRLPVMIHHWRWMTFLHWPYPPDLIQSMLPGGLTVETSNGNAWVGVLPFLMDEVRAPKLPPLPHLSRFPETNVRTYVRGPDGRAGISFFSLDAARLAVVAAARGGYGLPYYWSDMSIGRVGDELRYRSRRRWPGPTGASCEVRVEFGAPLPERQLDNLDHFLTARYRLYSTVAGRLVAANAQHPPWPLRAARLLHLRQTMLRAAGLPEPAAEPVVHASEGVRVRIAMWQPVQR